MKYVPPIGAATGDDPYITADVLAGIKGSAVPAEAIEHPMREIVAVIAGAGLTPSGENQGQLLEAILALLNTEGGGVFALASDLEAATASLLKGAWFVAADAAIPDHGDPATHGSLAWVLAQVGANHAEVVLPGGHTYVVATNLVVPENVTLLVGRGAVLDVALNATLTIDCDLRAGAQAMFSGAGTVTGRLAGRAALPQWWGARGDGITDDSAAIDKALAFPAVHFPAGTYLVSQPLTLHAHSALTGVGLPAAYIDWVVDWEQAQPGYAGRASIIQYPQGVHGALFAPVDNVSFEGLVFRCGQTRSSADKFLSGPAGHLVLSGCRFENLAQVCVDETGGVSFGAMLIHGCTFVGCGTVLAGPLVDCRISDNVFTTCDRCLDLTEGSGFNLVKGNRFEWGTQAVRVYRGRVNTVTGNIFDASEKAAVCLHQAKDQIIEGNVFWRNGRSGVDPGDRSHVVVLEACADNVICGNTFLSGGPDAGDDLLWPRFVLEFISAPGTRTVFSGNETVKGFTEWPLKDAWETSANSAFIDAIHIKGQGSPGQSTDQLSEMLKWIAFVAARPVEVHLHENRRFTTYTDFAPGRLRLVGHGGPTLIDDSGQAHSLLAMENLTYGPVFADPPNAMRASAAPTIGYWRQGSLVWNSAPASGQPLGWVCTASGAPGTWVAFATL